MPETQVELLQVPAAAGRLALRRLAVRPAAGPAVLCAERVGFPVAPGAGERLPELLEWLGWAGVPLDLGLRKAAQLSANACPLCAEHHAEWRVVRPGAPLPDLDLAAPGLGGLPALVTVLADACLRAALDGTRPAGRPAERRGRGPAGAGPRPAQAVLIPRQKPPRGRKGADDQECAFS
ncbi:hypothetical protein BIV57_11715 [Mangrovactinospora gilvigrisea]|uniref:Uncharacterized protein n=1 Tax=Mangrovactinospora gilvigrisea TaxID=1428644 RepID=A0A1J7BFG1_9ACTN|nr:hypothetical protein [Mangrovactinospora gilvigrisea]OIV37309.1 hypothetical protein BIV57_11715 [Mangrovactinospora gilvigrisea]